MEMTAKAIFARHLAGEKSSDTAADLRTTYDGVESAINTHVVGLQRSISRRLRLRVDEINHIPADVLARLATLTSAELVLLRQLCEGFAESQDAFFALICRPHFNDSRARHIALRLWQMALPEHLEGWNWKTPEFRAHLAPGSVGRPTAKVRAPSSAS